MTTNLRLFLVYGGLAALLLNSAALASEPAQVIELWPGTAPGENGDIGA